MFAGPSDVWFTFDCLMGINIDLPPTMEDMVKSKIEAIDREIRSKKSIDDMDIAS